MASKRTIAFITGANQGVGLATAKILAKDHGYHVIIGSRNREAGEKAAADIKAAGASASSVQLDLTSKSSIKAAIDTIDREFGHLDVLINNAGILLDGKPSSKDLSTWELYTRTFTTNVIGPATLTDGLVPLIRKAQAKPARVIFVSTTMASLKISTDESTPFYPVDYTSYDASKAAVNMLMINYHRKLADTGAKVNAVCPGLVKSNLTGYMEAGTSAEVGAQQVVKMATIGEDGPSRTFTRSDTELPW